MSVLDKLSPSELAKDGELPLLRHLEMLTTTGGGDGHPLPLSAHPYFVYCWDMPGPHQSWRVGRYSGADGWHSQHARDTAFPYTPEGEKAALRLAVQRNIALARTIGHRWRSEFLEDSLVPITDDEK